MINANSIKSDVDISKKKGYTCSTLRRLVFTITSEILSQQYNGNYSIRCLQSSIIIKKILEKFGINSKLIVGSLCVIQVHGTNPFKCNWAGFWDQDHHVWLITELHEIVDLTISQMNKHPKLSNPNTLQINPIWWHPFDILPQSIKYLPSGVPNVQLIGDEKQELLNIEKNVDEEIYKVMDGKFNRELGFNNILYSPKAYEEYYTKGLTWVQIAENCCRKGLPLPTWIENKENELMSKYKRKEEI